MLPKVKIKKIEIKDVFEIDVPEISIFRLTESIFYPKSDKKGFEIYASADGDELDLKIRDYVAKSLFLKEDKLYIVNVKDAKELGKVTYFYKVQ